MTQEPEISSRIREAADRLEVGEPPVRRIAARGMQRSRRRMAAIGGAAVVVLGAAGLVGTFATNGDGGQIIARDEEVGAERVVGLPAPAPAPAAVPGILEQGGAGGGAVGAPSGTGRREPAADAITQEFAASGGVLSGAPLPGAEPRIIKTADLRLIVPDEGFQRAFTEVQAIAARHQGFVVSSQTKGVESRSGTLTLRIPATDFEQTLVDLKELGEVESEFVSGEDVTAQFVDLEAQLRHWRAQEAVLLDLMARAKTVNDTLQVQRELQFVQLEIERIRGSLLFLEDQTDLSTMTVTVREEGVGAGKDDEGFLGSAWDRAVDGVLAVVSAVIIGLGYLLPIGLLLVGAWFAVRAVRARMAA